MCEAQPLSAGMVVVFGCSRPRSDPEWELVGHMMIDSDFLPVHANLAHGRSRRWVADVIQV